METNNQYGLSKKTNVAIAAMAALGAAQNSWQAIVAIGIIACLGISLQAVIDLKKLNSSNERKTTL